MRQAVVGEQSRMWERSEYEPSLWFYRFDAFYRPLGPERNLLRAYKGWHLAEAWDVQQRLERLREEDEARRKSREQRLAILNGVLMRASSALVRLNPDEARWGDVIAAVRLAVQELRHEYGEDVTTVKVEAAGVIPEWAATVIQMEEQQLDWIVANLSLAGGAVES